MSEEEIIKKANLIIENHREIDKMMVIEMVDLVQGLLDLYNKEKEENKELKERFKKVKKYIESEMYIVDNPTICGDEEDTIIELPISLCLYNEDLRKLLELLEEGE